MMEIKTPRDADVAITHEVAQATRPRLINRVLNHEYAILSSSTIICHNYD